MSKMQMVRMLLAKMQMAKMPIVEMQLAKILEEQILNKYKIF